MEWKSVLNSTIKKYWKLILCLFALSLLMTLLVPRDQHLQYQFSKGKPWQYELLTAPYDFPIYKTDVEVKQEQDSLREQNKPIYSINAEIGAQQINLLQENYRRGADRAVPYPYIEFLKKELTKLYGNGLISADELDKLRTSKFLEVHMIGRDGVLERIPRSQLYDLRAAFDHIAQEAKVQGLSMDMLSKLNISQYLQINVRYEEQLTKKMLDNALSNMSITLGMVQQGERIIDKGEVITPSTYTILTSLLREQAKRMGKDDHIMRGRYLGVFLGVSLILIILTTYLYFFLPEVVMRQKNVAFIFGLIAVFICATELNVQNNWFTMHVIPFVMIIIMVRVFFDSHAALIAYVATILLAILFVPNVLEFVYLQLPTGIMALIVLQDLRNRLQITKVAFLVFCCYIFLAFSLLLMTDDTIISVSNGYQLFYFGVNLVILMSSYVIITAVEKLLGYVSNLTLIELNDTNHPLLLKLSELAPGSFQHSNSVAILATEAATQIGANARLVRVGAFFHDIGKMNHPEYFTENQGEQGSAHRHLSPEESAQVIIRHVTDGIAMAQKYNLPEQVIDFIRTHHGKSLVKYFYITACNNSPDGEVDPAKFTYPGPNPTTKEMGILMLADVVEASSRSLKEYTEESVREHIDKMVDSVVGDGLLNDTPLTFRDIRVIKEVFYQKIKTMYHSRIAYPDLKK